MTELRVKCNDNVVLPGDKGKKLEIPLNTYLYVDDLVLELKGAEYKILTTSEGVTISESGIVSIPGTFNAGDVNGTDIIIRINAERGGEHYTTDKSIHVSPAPEEEAVPSKPSDFSVLKTARTPDVNQYVKTVKVSKPDSLIKIKVADFFLSDKITQYQVVRRFSNGEFQVTDEMASAGILVIEDRGACEIEISPIFKFLFGYEDGADSESAIRVPGSAEYTLESDYGFVGERIMSVGHVGFAGSSESCFVLTVPDGLYDVTLYKADEERSTIRINGGSVGTNVGNPGKGGRTGITPYSYRLLEVNTLGGIMTVSMDERGRTLKALEIRKSPSKERRPHIFIGGDSTASCYYPIEEQVPAPGRFQTGWGQVFGQYVTDEAVVINIAGGGTFAKSWYEMAFGGVITHGKPGDVFLIEEGINDRTYSNLEEMAEYLSKMIDECRAKGIIPILVTAMQTPKFWKDRDGAELPEFGRPEASGLFVFAEKLREVSLTKKAEIIDVAMITSNLYEKLGRTFVARNFHIFNPATNTEEDTLHLSYAGASNVAGIVATELFDRLENISKTGCTLSEKCFNPKMDLNFDFINAEGKKDKVTVRRISAIHKAYGK